MGKGRSALATQVKEMMGSAFESQYYGNKLLEAQGLDPSRLTNAAPMDDGIPPLQPIGVYLTPFLQALNVEWTAPPITDHVEVATIEITPSDTNIPTTVEVREQNGYTITALRYVTYKVRVMFTDMWGHTSPWSVLATGKPHETADYKFDVERARQLGNMTSLIGALNVDLLAGESLAENAVKQISLAQPEHGNQLPLSEVDFDAWPTNQTWAPTDTDSNGNPYIVAQIPSGVTAKVVDRSGIKWLEVVRGAGTISGLVNPFGTYRQRGVQPGVFYIASAYVQGAAGTRVRFSVSGSTDTLGTTQLTIAQTEALTLDGSEAGQRIFIKFLGDPTYKNIKLRCDTVDAGTTTRWTRFQLERADEKTEPSAWTPGIFSSGVVNARMLTAIDANIANGLFKNAAIGSAAIKDLTADKITAGTISTTEIVVATLLRMASGGQIVAGNTKLDSGGLTLATQGSYDTKAMSSSSKITDTTDHSALAFYKSTTWYGTILRSDGDSAHDGIIALHATVSGNLTSNSTGRVEVFSVTNGYGYVYCYQDVIAKRNVRAIGDLNSDNDVNASGTMYAANFNAGGTTLLGHSHSGMLTTATADSRYVRFSTGGTINGNVYVSAELSGDSIWIYSGGWKRIKVWTDGYLYV